MLFFSDIDGTLFDNRHRKDLIPEDRTNTANWAQFNAAHKDDQPVPHLIQLLGVVGMHHHVVYVTSRTETELASTREQLRHHEAPIGYISMRGVDDHRPSAEVKLDQIAYWLREFRVDDGVFTLLDDDFNVCMAVAERYPYAKIIKVPSRCCAYLATSAEVDL